MTQAVTAGTASPALAAALRPVRAELNSRFAAARRRLPGLDGDSFGAFLVGRVGPIVDAVAAAAGADHAARVAYAAYDVALELIGGKLAGAGARDGRVGEAWSKLLAAAPRQAAADPERVTLGVANAIVQLAGTPGAHVDAWVDAMATLAPAASELELWLGAGQVLAWRAGLAHYREGALARLDTLPRALWPALTGAPPDADLDEVRRRLGADPWFVPARPAETGLRVAARVGGFRGFGGLFLEPPRVAGGKQLVVASGGESWVLVADAWGATFHRASEEERAAAAGASALPAGLRLRGATLALGGAELSLPLRGAVTSASAVGSTLAVTSADTHAVLLVALP